MSLRWLAGWLPAWADDDDDDDDDDVLFIPLWALHVQNLQKLV